MYSSGYYHINNEMLEILKVMFIQNKVDMYFCGHCHHLEHLNDNGIDYIVNGAFAKNGSVGKIFNTKFASSSNGFTSHEINGNIMTTKFHNSNDEIIYKYDKNQTRNT